MTAAFATPWHALTVTDVWYCRQQDGEPDALDLPCRDEDGWCTGHGEEAEGRYQDPDFDVEHAPECGPEEDPNCLTVDLFCDGGLPVPKTAGVYRLRALVPAGSRDGSGASLEWETAR